MTPNLTRRRDSGGHDCAQSQTRLSGLYHGERERCRGGRIYTVVVHRCIKGSLALSSLVLAENFVHRMLRPYDANISRFVAPSRLVLEKPVEWGWPRERFAHIPNFVNVELITARSIW